MPHVLRLLLILAAALSAGASAWAAPQVSLAGSHPGLSGQLGRDAPLYLRISYQSDVPIRVQAKGFFEGVEVTKEVRWNPSPAYPAGNGEAMAWIAYRGATRLDEIRIEVSDANWKQLTVLRAAVNVTWSSAPGSRGTEPDWVVRQNQVQQSAAAAGRSSAGASGVLIGALVTVGFPGYFVLQALFAWRFSSGWRIAALAPLVIMAPLFAHALFALAMGSNLWPLLVILTAPVFFVYLCALWAGRFVMRGAIA